MLFLRSMMPGSLAFSQLTYDSLGWLGFLDKSNLLKIPDCRLFSVLKTLPSYRPYSHSVKNRGLNFHASHMKF